MACAFCLAKWQQLFESSPMWRSSQSVRLL